MMNAMPSKQLFDALGLEALSPIEREQVLSSVGELVFKDALMRCLESLSPADREAFLGLPEADPGKAAAFLAERVPGADRFMQESLDDLTSDILAVTQDS
jgi:hypothetical protein